MKLLSFVLYFVIFSSTPLLAQSEIYQYRLPNYPVSRERCSFVARELSQRFSQMTGRPVAQAVCQETYSRKLDIMISYTGEIPLKLVSTDDEFSSREGMYSDQKSCEAALPKEVQAFEFYTGLKAVVSYCYSEIDLPDVPRPFVPRVDGFGTPKLRPWLMEGNIYGAPFMSMQYVQEKAFAAVNREGLLWPRVSADQLGSFYTLVIKYYAPRKLPLSFEKRASYPDPQSCLTRRAEVLTLMERVEATPMVSVCAQQLSWSSVTDLYVLTYAKASFEVKTPAAPYQTFGECDQDRDRVVAFYRKELQLDAVGAVCMRPTDDFVIRSGVAMMVYIKI